MKSIGWFALCSSLVLFGCAPGDDDDGITVTVNDSSGAPLADVEIVTHGADGTFISILTTNVDGQVSFNLPSGGMFTYAELAGGAGDNTTIGGLRTGHQITFGGTSTTTPPTLDVTVPGMFTGATSYSVDIGCDSDTVPAPGTPAVVSVDEECNATSVDIVALAMDAGGPIAYFTQTGVDPTAGPVTLAGPWETTFDTFDLTISSISGGATAGSFVDVRRGQLSFDGGGAFLTADGTISINLVPGFGDAIVYGTTVFNTDGTIGFLNISDAASPSSATVDLATDLPPVVESVTIDVTTDPTRPIFNYTSSGDLSTFDLMQAGYDWDNGTDAVDWFISDDAKVSGFQTPELPDELSASRPAAGDTAGTPNLAFLEFDFLNGADEAFDFFESTTTPLNYTITGTIAP